MANSSNIIKLLIMFAVCELVQLLILNNLNISGFINPYIYILVILSMPFGTSTAMMMIVSMITGLSVDIFCNTIGMHAFACVLIGFVRQYVLKLIAFRDEYRADALPTANTYGMGWYLKYALILISTHHVALFFIEQFDTLFFWPTLLRVMLSIVASSIFIFVGQLFIPSYSTRNYD